MEKSTQRVNYDSHLVPAETAARMEREGAEFQHVSSEESSDVNGGFTSDQEGLLNNYAIEPEMYVNEPGDLREQKKVNHQNRIETIKEVNQTDETGNLTMDKDSRGKGVGII